MPTFWENASISIDYKEIELQQISLRPFKW